MRCKSRPYYIQESSCLASGGISVSFSTLEKQQSRMSWTEYAKGLTVLLAQGNLNVRGQDSKSVITASLFSKTSWMLTSVAEE
jgi:hypothetical protein